VVDALTGIADKGAASTRKWWFTPTSNHPDEITAITQAATNKLFDRGITFATRPCLSAGQRHSCVMGVLIKRLSFVNVHPYYITCTTW